MTTSRDRLGASPDFEPEATTGGMYVSAERGSGFVRFVIHDEERGGGLDALLPVERVDDLIGDLRRAASVARGQRN